jgi:hypothetical protein
MQMGEFWTKEIWWDYKMRCYWEQQTPFEEQYHGKSTRKPEEHHWEHMRTWWEHKKHKLKISKKIKFNPLSHPCHQRKKRWTHPLECMFGSSHCPHIYAYSIPRHDCHHLFIYFCLKLIPPSTKHTIPMDDDDDDDEESIPSCCSQRKTLLHTSWELLLLLFK